MEPMRPTRNHENFNDDNNGTTNAIRTVIEIIRT